MSRSTFGHSDQTNHGRLFAALVLLSLMLWFIYRSIFTFPVLFDETLGKALFFGVPIWIYLNITGQKKIIETIDPRRLRVGLLYGLAFAGILGFSGSLFSLIVNGSAVLKASLFVSPNFWWQFLLAVLTSFWETLFFFSFVQTVLRTGFKQLTFWKRIALTVLIFVIFHLPNTVLRFDGIAIYQQLFLLGWFALGQALLFNAYKNAYLLMMIHAVWGLILLVHF